MESKYYTPEIDEFYVSFEYEVCIDYYSQKYDTVRVIDIKDLIELQKIEDTVGFDYTRVKYLDREDILSTGFELTSEKVPWQFTKGKYRLTTPVHTARASLPENSRINILDTVDDHSYFDGIIKNKSEFRKLLKQLNII